MGGKEKVKGKSGVGGWQDAKSGATLCRENKNPGGTCQPGFGKSDHHPGRHIVAFPRREGVNRGDDGG
jgi:hypothetical protein